MAQAKVKFRMVVFPALAILYFQKAILAVWFYCLSLWANLKNVKYEVSYDLKQNDSLFQFNGVRYFVIWWFDILVSLKKHNG